MQVSSLIGCTYSLTPHRTEWLRLAHRAWACDASSVRLGFTFQIYHSFIDQTGFGVQEN